MQDRLLNEEVERWVYRISNEELADPAAVQELNVRLLAALAMLLRQHRMSWLGRCRVCSAGWRWRAWRQPLRCMVRNKLHFALVQDIEMVWGQLRECVEWE